MGRTRFETPDALPGATNFSRHDAVLGSENVVRLVKSQPRIWNRLRRDCDLSVNWGRGREPGHWELVALAFVSSQHVDIQPWHASSSDSLWRLCGFSQRPPYKRVWRRLRELEAAHEAFQRAAGSLIQLARQHDSRVGAHVHIDSTEDETHAGLIHDCERGECPRMRTRRSGWASRPRRVETSRARETRQAENADAPEEVEREHGEVVHENGRSYKRFNLRGCWYRSLDTEAGVRLYEGPRGAKRFWHGYYNTKVVDHFTGGVIFSGTFSASTQEYNLFDECFDRTAQMIGDVPQSMTGDKGFSVKSVFQKCATNGTAAVFPWRKSTYAPVRVDRETHDRHGTPRCKHCGGPTSFKRFSKNAGRPRIWFDCMIGATLDCTRTQSISCSTDWRSLIALWRTEPLYHELRQSHSRYEAVHDWWRDRYSVGADTLANRPKMRGIGAHKLRASAAMLIEWIRICTIEGWLGSPRRNHNSPTRTYRDAAHGAATDLLNMRARIGLHAAYGPRAAALGLGPNSPPSRQ